MTTLLDARNQVRLRCDQAVTSGTPFVSDAELTWYLNSSRAEHYDLLSSLFEDYNLSSQTQTIAGGVVPPVLTVPADLYKLRGVDLALTTGANLYASLDRYSFRDRNQMNAPGSTGVWLQEWGPTRRYRLQGQTIVIIPGANAPGTYQLWYTPVLPDLVADTDLFTSLGHWEDEYAITDACIKVLAKEESDTSVFVGQKGQLIQRIERSAKDRDAGGPEVIASTRRQGSGFGNGSGWW